MLTPRNILLALLVLSCAGLALLDPIAQSCAYHDYGDQRTLLGIPYFWNVVSNLPMLFIGAYGLRQCALHGLRRPAGVARWIPWVMSLGIFLTCFGSAYYHATPSNATLLWDRLPMTLMFMSLFSLLVYDYLDPRAGSLTFWLALPLGAASVLYWHFTEAAGRGDLRPYALVQFFPIVAALAFMFFFPKKVPYMRYMALLIGWYAVAKCCEHWDKLIYEALGFWSGHTLKHLFGAVGLVYVMKLLDRWRVERAAHTRQE